MAGKLEAVATLRAQTVLTWLAGLAVVYRAKAVLIPVALAVLLTLLLAPVVTRLRRLGVPKVLAGANVVAVGFALVGYVASDQIVRLAVACRCPSRGASDSSRSRAGALNRSRRSFPGKRSRIGRAASSRPSVSRDNIHLLGHAGTDPGEDTAGHTPRVPQSPAG